MSKKIVFFILSVLVLSVSAWAQQLFQHLLGANSIPAFTWTGGGGDANWNTAANWSTGVVPGASNTAHFIGYACSSNCNPTMNVNISVKGVSIQSDYTGTITQSAGVTITLGTDGWTQANGTFLGGNSAISMGGPFSLSGGTFTATSGSWTVFSNFAISGSPTFNANGGTLVFQPSLAISINPGSVNYNHVTFSSPGAVNHTLATGSTMNVLGTLTLASGNASSSALVDGTISAQGNVTASSYGMRGSTVLKIAGSGNQTITGVSTARFPAFEVASTGGTVTYSGYLVMTGNYIYTSGTVVASGTTVMFSPGSSVSVTPGTFNYNHVYFSGYNLTFTLSGTMNVAGTLTLHGTSVSPRVSLTGGTIDVKGDVTLLSYGAIGTTLIKLSGNSNQTVTGDATSGIPQMEIASTGGTVSYVGTFLVSRAYTHTSGTVNAGTSHVIFGLAASAAITPGSTAFYDVSFNGYTTVGTLSGTLTVNGTLTFAGTSSSPAASLDGGTVQANGNVVFSSQGLIGTAALTLGGSTSTTFTVSGAAQRLRGTITVNKTSSATVTLQSNAVFNGTGQDVTITAGKLDLNGYTMNVTDVLTISTAGSLICSGGTYTRGTLTNNGTIDCAGYGFNWTGAGGNTNWNTAANWAGGVAPGASDIVVFKDTYCGATCNATINVNSSVKGVRLLSGYTGTITQSAGFTLTVGTSGWTQSAGIFAGGNSAITINGPFDLSAGSFQSTSGTLTATSTWSITGTGAYTHNSGTLSLSGYVGSITTPAATVYNNVLFGNGSNGASFRIYGQLTVNGDLTVNLASTNGYCDGNMVASKNLVVTSLFRSPNCLIELNGSGAQNITGTANGYFPGLTINSTGSVVFNTTGIPKVTGEFTYLQGSVTWTNPTIAFVGESPDYFTITPGAMSFQNVQFGNFNGARLFLSGTMNINGNLSSIYAGCGACNGIKGGTINLSGDFTDTANWASYISSFEYGFQTALNFVGSSAQTWTSTSGTVLNAMATVNNSAGVTLTAATSLAYSSIANAGLALTTGTFNLAGGTFGVKTLSLNGNTLTKSGGSLNVNGSVVGTGALYGGTVDP